MENKCSSEKMIPILTYLAVLTIVAIAVHKGIQDSSQVGSRSNRDTISETEIQKESADAKGALNLDSFLEHTDVLSRHARFQEVENLSKDRLIKSSPLEKLRLLRGLALDQLKMLHFKEADQYLQSALSIALAEKNNRELMLIYDDYIDLYSQAFRFADSDNTRNVCQFKLNEYFEKANALSSDRTVDEGTRRLVRNHCRIGLIEMGRLLELDCFDPEPGGHFD